MNIFLRLTLDCSPDAAWKAITSPAVFTEVSAPLLRFHSREKNGFPPAWSEGTAHLVGVWLFGFIPIGTQSIDISLSERPGGVRMLIDSGAPRSGALAVVRSWDHRMAISEGPGGLTLYRDRLVVRAGLLTPLVWLGLWSFWQFRASKLRRAARNWLA